MKKYYPKEEFPDVTKVLEGLPVFLSVDGSSEKKPNDPKVGTVCNVKIDDNNIVKTSSQIETTL